MSVAGDGRRRCLCLAQTRGRSQSEGWEIFSFSRCLSLFIRSRGLIRPGPTGPDTEMENASGLIFLNQPLVTSPSFLPHPPHPIPPVMAQVVEESAVSVKSLQPTPSLLRSIALIASCTSAMIVNVGLSCQQVRQLTRGPKDCDKYVHGHCPPFRRSGSSNPSR